MRITPTTRRIVKRCRKCGGSGNKLKGVKPITFVRCNKCGGRGGQTVGVSHD